MKKFLAYFFGGLACVGVGAGAYITLADNYRPSAAPQFLSQRQTASQSIDDLLPLVGDRFKDNESKSSGGAMGSLGADSSTIAPRDDKKESTILFMGDAMLGRNVAAKIAKNGSDYPFAKIKDVVSSADYAVANLEGPVTKINTAPKNDMRFHFDPSLAAVLADTGFDALSLANNHGLDQGAKGEKDTEKNLQDAGLKYFGRADSDSGPVLRFTIHDSGFTIIGLHDVYRKIDPKTVATEIAAAKKEGDTVIVYPHWGDEYQHIRNTRQVELAHAFIDAGADLVIGSHPHVVEGIEIYKGKPIFYSLGNLVFDQYFSDDTQQGLGLRLNLGDSGIASVELLPYAISAGQPALSDGDAKAKMLAALASWSDFALKGQIIGGKIVIK